MPLLSGPDWLPTLYLGCFAFGLIFTVVSSFLSFGHMGGADGHHVGDGHLHLPDLHAGHGHADVGHAHGHVGVDAHGAHGDTGSTPLTAEPRRAHPERSAVSWLNLPTLLAGLTWFGGVGYLLTQNTLLPWTMTLGLAAVGGLLGGYIIYFFFAKVLWPAQTPPMNAEEYALPGTPARVVSGIGPGGTGEIMYTKGGTRAVAGARSEDGSPLPKGTEVRVVRYERGLAYVVPRTVADPAGTAEGAVTTRLPPTTPPRDPAASA